VLTTLAALPQAVAAAGLGSPAILVIGEVVRYARSSAASTVERAA
jgi:siroheme synthase